MLAAVHRSFALAANGQDFSTICIVLLLSGVRQSAALAGDGVDCACITPPGFSDIAQVDCGAVAPGNKCMVAERSDDTNALYPVDYGTSCKVWQERGDEACWDNVTDAAVASPASWCNKKWCYVDPCTCAKDPAIVGGMSDLFNKKDGTQAGAFYYSYTNCAGSSNTRPGQIKVDREKACPNGYVYTTTSTTTTTTTTTLVGGGVACECVEPAGYQTVPLMSCGSQDPGQKCMKSQRIAAYPNALYPKNYGTSCQVWPDRGNEACWNSTSDEAYPVGLAPASCHSRWCTVDPCTCPNDPAIQGGMSPYFNNADGTQAGPFYFSYDNCGSLGAWLKSAGATVKATALDRTQICPNGFTFGKTTTITTTAKQAPTTAGPAITVQKRPTIGPAVTAKFGFKIKDKVSWKRDDPKYVPKGQIGFVVGFTVDRVRVKFPEGTWTFNPSELERQPDDAVLSAAGCETMAGLSAASALLIFHVTRSIEGL